MNLEIHEYIQSHIIYPNGEIKNKMFDTSSLKFNWEKYLDNNQLYFYMDTNDDKQKMIITYKSEWNKILQKHYNISLANNSNPQNKLPIIDTVIKKIDSQPTVLGMKWFNFITTIMPIIGFILLIRCISMISPILELLQTPGIASSIYFLWSIVIVLFNGVEGILFIKIFRRLKQKDIKAYNTFYTLLKVSILISIINCIIFIITLYIDRSTETAVFVMQSGLSIIITGLNMLYFNNRKHLFAKTL